MEELLKKLRRCCGSCVRAPQNRNQRELTPACSECELKHTAAQALADIAQAIRPSLEGLSFPQVLRWYANRLVEVHGESPNVDFVHLLRDRANELEAALSKIEHREAVKS